MTYSEQLRSSEWKTASGDIRRLDNHKCRDCGAIENLEVHHCFYVSKLKLWEHPRELMVTVCHTCHERRSKLEEASHVELAKIMAVIPPERLEKFTWSVICTALRETMVEGCK